MAAGNSFADATAKSAAALSTPTLPSVCFLSPQYTPNYTQEEKNKRLQDSTARLATDNWIYISNKLVIPKTQLHTVLRDIHNSLHIGPRALYNLLSPLIHCPTLMKHLIIINQQRSRASSQILKACYATPTQVTNSEDTNQAKIGKLILPTCQNIKNSNIS